MTRNRCEQCPTVPFRKHFVEWDGRAGFSLPDTTCCRVSIDLDAGTLTISKQAFAENTAARFRVSSRRDNQLSTDFKLKIGLSVACERNTTGYCECGESGSEVRD